MSQADSELDAFVATLRNDRLFERGATVAISRAPGRLDVMGGIADYSGSLVLQRPIAEATFAAVQPVDRPALEFISRGRPPCTVPIDMLAPARVPVCYEQAQLMFRPHATHASGDSVTFPHWVAYVAGVFLVLAREGVMPLSGARVVVSSRVPEGKGVSSSAAVETAAMQAAASAFGIDLHPRDIALLSQKAENLVAGAPCGVMDQMTCVFGEQHALLALLCQPAELHPPVRIPDDIEFWGIDSGERHAVSGSDYKAVRTAAFMGLRILASHAGVTEDYLANLGVSEFERELVRHLPEDIDGADFLERYSGTCDTITAVEPARVYRVKSSTAHPVYERQRAEVFRRLLSEPDGEARRVQLGELMYESHRSYVACRLNSPGTDRLINLVRAEGAVSGLYGARATGGGNGGTVAVIGRKDSADAVTRVVNAYERQTGYRPHVFSGSSPGLRAFGAHSATV